MVKKKDKINTPITNGEHTEIEHAECVSVNIILSLMEYHQVLCKASVSHLTIEHVYSLF